MKEYTFPYYISFGRNDNVDKEITCELSNKDGLRLERSAKEGGRFHLSEDNEIDDIYNKIFDKVINIETEFLLANPGIVRDWKSWQDKHDQPMEIISKRL